MDKSLNLSESILFIGKIHHHYHSISVFLRLLCRCILKQVVLPSDKQRAKVRMGLCLGVDAGSCIPRPGIQSQLPGPLPGTAPPRSLQGEARAPSCGRRPRSTAPPEGPESLLLGVSSGGRSPGHHPHLPPRMDCPEEAPEALEVLQPVLASL